MTKETFFNLITLMRKLLQVFFIFFSIVIIGEVFYLYYLINNQSSHKETQSQSSQKTNYKKAVNEKKLDYIKMIMNQKIPLSKFSRYFVVYEISGKLTKIDTDGSLSPNKNIMKFGLWIKPDDYPNPISFYLSPKSEQNLKIFASSKSGEMIAGKEDLKEGSFITIQEFQDVTLNNVDDAFIIIKINKG